MSKVSWGKPKIYSKDLETVGAKWKELPTPIEDSTELSTEKGDKLEALIEGGEAEDVKYKSNKYTLAYGIRRMKERVMPYADVDGVIAHRHAVAIVPEDPAAPGCLIENSIVSSEDVYNAADGHSVTYTHDVLKPTSGNAVKFGTINVTKSGDEITGITCTEMGTTYSAVSSSGDGYSSSNPAALGWYERTGAEGSYEYRQTWDATPMEGKTYYTAATA